MKEGQVIKIDQSIKVSSWGNEFPIEKQDPTRQIFQKYAAQQNQKNNVNHYQFNEDFNQFNTDESQVKSIETGFRKLKNEQIQKLKDLKNQYEEIRKITTDYAAPKGSRTGSMHSSSNSQSQAVISPKNSKAKPTGGRQVQILELQKKQLEIMVENSMKKIEELLHNEMQYKKLIHELKLKKESKNYGDSDNQMVIKTLKRREKQTTQKAKVLQLQRQTFISSINGTKDRIKYLESSLTSTEQELRKILDQKRNYEELIRMEKDKYMNLQIQFRREKRQHEIFEKDKNAEINRLLKLKDIKQSNYEKDLKNTITTLQQQIHIKEERYTLLLQKFENLQKDKIKEAKEAEIKIVNEIMNKSNSSDPQNKFVQQAISGILNRLSDLQKKPMIEIDHIVNHQHEQHSLTVQQLSAQINQLNKSVLQNKRIISDLQNANHQFKTIIEKQDRELLRYIQSEKHYEEQIQRLKNLNRQYKKDKSSVNVFEVKNHTEQSYTNVSYSNDQVRNLQNRLQYLTKEKQSWQVQRQTFDNQNRQLRMRISKLEFEVEKAGKQSDFSKQLISKTYETQIQTLNKDIEGLRSEIVRLTNDNLRIKNEVGGIVEVKDQQNLKLKSTVETLLRQKNNINGQIRQTYTTSINKTRQENTSKLAQLSTTIQNLTVQNQKLQQQKQQSYSILQENQRLLALLKKMRYINSESDGLWQNKEIQYQKIQQILHSIKN